MEKLERKPRERLGPVAQLDVKQDRLPARDSPDPGPDVGETRRADEPIKQVAPERGERVMPHVTGEIRLQELGPRLSRAQPSAGVQGAGSATIVAAIITERDGEA
ncbi:hypothetical protein WMF20_05745 [Sorangium sp. So ce834]|uniref:hypothetical protein n=1 Tax=Sorangium sp. So ce834 TaxID=3133321 RepID=UPI003F61627B